MGRSKKAAVSNNNCEVFSSKAPFKEAIHLRTHLFCLQVLKECYEEAETE